MGVFGSKYIQTNNITVPSIPIEDMKKILEGLDLYDEYFSDEEVLEEDAAAADDAMALMRQSKAKLKMYKKEIKANMKAGDNSEALKIANKAKKELEDIKKNLNKLDWKDSESRSFILKFFSDFGYIFLAGFVLGLIGIVVQSTTIAIKDAKYLNDHPELYKDYNQLKVRVYRIIDANIEAIDAIIAGIKREMK